MNEMKQTAIIQTCVAIIFVLVFVGVVQATTTTSYIVEISETTSIYELVEEGDYNYNPHSYISSLQYPVSSAGIYEIIVVDFGKTPRGQSLNKAEALEKLAELGLRPATMTELLALGAQHKTCAYGKAGIVELDTAITYKGFARNGILTQYSEKSERIMYIDDISRPEENSHSDYCFAAVKISK